MQSRPEITTSESKATHPNDTQNVDELGSINSDDTPPWDVPQDFTDHEGENGHRAPGKPWMEQTSEEKIQEFIRRESMAREKSNPGIITPGFDPSTSFDIDQNKSPLADEPVIAPTLAVADIVPTMEEAPVSGSNPASTATLLNAFGIHAQTRDPMPLDANPAPKGCCIIS